MATARPPSACGTAPPAAITAVCSTLHGPGDLRFLSQLIERAPGDDELLCETLVTAISPGTELAAYRGLEPLRTTVSPYPRLVGYLNVARVLASGGQLAERYAPGQRIISFTSHRSHFTVREDRIAGVVPDGLDNRQASLAYLYRLALSGLRRGQWARGKRVAVIGLGPIGLCAVRLAALEGCDVVAFSNAAPSRALAETFGAHALPKSASAGEHGDGPGEATVDIVLTTANSWSDWELALRLAGFNAVVSVLGFPGRGQPAPAFNPLASAHFYDRQLAFVAAGMAPETIGSGVESPERLRDDIAWILERMEVGELLAERLIAAELPAAALADAYAFLEGDPRPAGTVLLTWS